MTTPRLLPAGVSARVAPRRAGSSASHRRSRGGSPGSARFSSMAAYPAAEEEFVSVSAGGAPGAARRAHAHQRSSMLASAATSVSPPSITSELPVA